jgi:fluoride exporter
MPYLLVAIGSAIGGVSRFALGAWILRQYGSFLPWGTLTINILGSVLIGVFASTVRPTQWRQFLMVGVCGGFTTFSSFSLESVNLLRSGHPGRSLAYIALSVIVCLAGVWVGHLAGDAIAAK